MTISALRTPDEYFAALPGYAYNPHFIEDLAGYEGLRVHYLDEGDQDAEHTFLCLHGQPTWSYLYRKMIPVFTASGGRVIAPDLLGFGRSDKPTEDTVYTFNFHREMLLAFIKALGLQRITLVCQDWGGILGLTLPMEMPERFHRLIVMNTAIPVGESAGPGFDAWKAFNASQPDMDIAGLMKRSTPILSNEEAQAYAAPFPDLNYKAGVRRFPELVMVEPEMEGVDVAKRARAWWQHEWKGKSFMAIGMQDPVLGPPAMQALRSIINGCPSPLEIADGGHFVQEYGEVIAAAALEHFAQS